MLPFLADLLVRSTALILFAWLATVLLRKAGASAAMRHLVWSWAIAGLALLPLLALTMPALPLAILPQVVIEPIADRARRCRSRSHHDQERTFADPRHSAGQLHAGCRRYAGLAGRGPAGAGADLARLRAGRRGLDRLAGQGRGRLASARPRRPAAGPDDGHAHDLGHARAEGAAARRSAGVDGGSAAPASSSTSSAMSAAATA